MVGGYPGVHTVVGMVGRLPWCTYPGVYREVHTLVYTLLLYHPGYTTVYTTELRTVSAVQGVVR